MTRVARGTPAALLVCFSAEIRTRKVAETYCFFGDPRMGKSIDWDGPGPAVAEVERFVYDGMHMVLAFNGEGSLTHRYLHGPLVDQILADEDLFDGEVYWALADNLGTVRTLVDNDGNRVRDLVFSSWGDIVEDTNPAVDFPFAFTGREFDKETGLYYYRARYYSPQLGRFISEDPLGFAAGDTNLSRYVGNSPANFVDPSGLILEVDGQVVTPESELYKRLATSNVSREILDKMIASGATYKYDADALARELDARNAIVEVAHEVAQLIKKKKRLVFGAPMQFEKSPYPNARTACDFWDRLMRRKKITTECHQAVMIVWILAMRRWLGDQKFNAYYETLARSWPNAYDALAPWKFEIRWTPWATKPGEPQIVPAPTPDNPRNTRYNTREEIFPGDRIQFPNPGGESPWHNENSIYLGTDENGKMWFFAHPFGIVTAEHILAALAQIYRDSGKPGEPMPYMDRSVIGCPDFQYIWHLACEE